MAIPNLVHEVEAARQKYPEAWANAHTGNAHTEDFNRLLARDVRLKHGTRWGMNGKRGNPDDLSDDVLAYAGEGTAIDSRTGGPMEIIDVIAKAGAPDAHPTWIVGPGGPGDIGTFVGDFTVPDTPGAAHACRLGCSLFWGMSGVRDHPNHLRENLLWIRDVLGADYVRVFAVLGGDFYSGVDPWEFSGSFLRWPNWRSLLGHLTDLCFDIYGLQTAWTLFGSRGQTPALSDCERVVAEWLGMAASRLPKIASVEVWNEYNVNGATTSDLRHLARKLRAGLPAGFPVSLSSPGSVHACSSVSEIQAEVRKMYDGLPEANFITPHWCRANHVAPDLGPFAPALKSSNEPRGPKASASGGDVDDPAVLASDYRAAIAAGYVGYVYHPLGGIWGGRCHPQFDDQNVWPSVFSSPGAAATAAQLKAIRQGGAAPPIDPPIDPGDPDMPLPPYDEGWISNVVRPAVIARYQQANHPLDDLYPVWITRTQHDYYAGMTQQDSLAKHLAELDAALGL